jgi:hypothetical protein
LRSPRHRQHRRRPTLRVADRGRARLGGHRAVAPTNRDLRLRGTIGSAVDFGCGGCERRAGPRQTLRPARVDTGPRRAAAGLNRELDQPISASDRGASRPPTRLEGACSYVSSLRQLLATPSVATTRWGDENIGDDMVMTSEHFGRTNGVPRCRETPLPCRFRWWRG